MSLGMNQLVKEYNFKHSDSVTCICKGVSPLSRRVKRGGPWATS